MSDKEIFKSSAPNPKRNCLCHRPRWMKKEQSLMDKKCGKEFGTWNGGISVSFVRGKELPLERTCLPKESPR
jgi:hypothetical protein